MNNTDMNFLLVSFGKLKAYFNKIKMPRVCDDLEYMKLLVVSQDKELSRVKDQLWEVRKENIKLIAERRRNGKSIRK